MKWRSRRANTVFALLLIEPALSAHARAQSPPNAPTRASIDQAVRRCLEQDGTPSASIAVVADGRLLYAAAYGKATLQPATPASSTTRYQLASLSKTFTAQAVLLLEAAGALSLEDHVSKWYPDLTAASTISLRQLLNHTSGYPDHYPESYPAGAKGRATPPDRIIQQWAHRPLLFPPGTQFHYSNLEYEIAGRIVEKVSGKPLFQFMQQQIFNPLHMDTTLDLDTIPDRSTALATGYEQTALAGLEPAPYEGPGWSFGAGQVVTSAHDVALWDIAFLKRTTLPARQLAEELEPAHLANGSTYPSALGLFVSHDQGVTRYYHSGQGLGFQAVNMIFPDSLSAIVVLTNTNAVATYLKIADELSFLLFPPTPHDSFARRIFLQLQNGTLDRSLLSDDLNRFLVPGRLRQYSSSLSPLGPLEAFSLFHEQTDYGWTTRDYDVIAGGKKLRLHLLLLPDHKLQDLTVSATQ